MTTRRDNILKVFRHETPEWIPLTGHVDPYNQPSHEGMAPELAKALGEVKWGDESIVTFSRYLDLDIMDWFGLPMRITRPNVTVENTTEGDVTTSVWHTPKGALRSVHRICRDESGAVSGNWTEHLVKGPEDLPALASIFEDEVIECHVIRLGDVVFATNPFELFVEYGIRIRCRSRALQTFLVQLADAYGGGGYLPTQRGLDGGHYSALVKSNWVGPEGGAVLVEETVRAINALFEGVEYPRTR